MVITGQSDALPVPFQHSYTLEEFDDVPMVANDPAAPANGFVVINGMPCSVIVSISDPSGSGKFIPSEPLSSLDDWR